MEADGVWLYQQSDRRQIGHEEITVGRPLQWAYPTKEAAFDAAYKDASGGGDMLKDILSWKPIEKNQHRLTILVRFQDGSTRYLTVDWIPIIRY